jgi:hypothetical protein
MSRRASAQGFDVSYRTGFSYGNERGSYKDIGLRSGVSWCTPTECAIESRDQKSSAGGFWALRDFKADFAEQEAEAPPLRPWGILSKSFWRTFHQSWQVLRLERSMCLGSLQQQSLFYGHIFLQCVLPHCLAIIRLQAWKCTHCDPSRTSHFHLPHERSFGRLKRRSNRFLEPSSHHQKPCSYYGLFRMRWMWCESPTLASSLQT